MLQILVKLIINVIGIFFVTYSLCIFQNRKFDIRNFFRCTIMYILGYFLLEDSYWKVYIIKNIYLFLIFVVYLIKCKMKIKRYIPFICAMLSLCELLKIASGVISGLCMVFISAEGVMKDITTALLSIIFMSLSISFLIYMFKNRQIKVEITFFKKCMICFIYILIVCVKIPFLYTDLRDAYTTKLVFLSILCCTVIFLIISGIDKHNAQKERERIEENNKKLSSRLHKSQEILPAMVQVLSHVTENGGTEMETQKAQELLVEVNDLYGRQLRENSEEDLQLKNFCSTGLKMLDQQLKVYQMEAIDRNVNLDIFVQAPINDLIKKDGIDQWRLQRAVGDLVRNAFRAVEKEDKKCRANKHILLIIGCRYEGILEVAVVDNGTEFPLHVIEAFGKRGVTTGGTGNGLADLVEFADDMGASISVDEFDGRTSLFTKRVSISFDKQRKNNFNSVRKEFVGGSFWNIW